jgi:isopenicillin N synthase-like dioxygenase
VTGHGMVYVAFAAAWHRAEPLPFYAYSMSEIPLVDLDANESEVVNQLRDACSLYGFFYLKGHGIPQDQMDGVLAAAREFFSQREEAKAKVGPGSPGPQFRGYSPWRAIALDPKWQKGGDTREQFTIGREVLPDSDEAKRWPSILGPNKWPESSEGFDGSHFKDMMKSYYSAVEKLGLRVLPLLAKSLDGQPEDLLPLFAPPLASGVKDPEFRAL